MNVQEATNLTITEGEVKAIHDSSNHQLWGRLNYDTTYKGDTTQQTYSGKNLVNTPDGTRSSGGLDIVWSDNICTFSGTASSTSAILTSLTTLSDYLPQGTYTFSIHEAIEYKVSLSVLNADTENYINYEISPTNKSVSININYNTKSYRVSVSGWTSSTQVSGTLKQPMLEAGSTATDYEPYVGGIPAPNPDYPQDVNVVTGTQTVTINEEQSYTIDLGSIELCKIGTYQDYIYKSGNDWYIHKATGKIVFDGTENWVLSGQPSNYLFNTPLSLSLAGTSSPLASERFIWTGIANPSQQNVIYVNSSRSIVFINPISNGTVLATNVADWKTWLASNNTTVYYPLSTPTDTKITDATLISQLNAIHDWLTRYGYTATVAGNLPLIISQTELT